MRRLWKEQGLYAKPSPHVSQSATIYTVVVTAGCVAQHNRMKTSGGLNSRPTDEAESRPTNQPINQPTTLATSNNRSMHHFPHNNNDPTTRPRRASKPITISRWDSLLTMNRDTPRPNYRLAITTSWNFIHERRCRHLQGEYRSVRSRRGEHRPAVRGAVVPSGRQYLFLWWSRQHHLCYCCRAKTSPRDDVIV